MARIFIVDPQLLRRLSSTTNVKLRDVAAQIVETRAIPQDRTTPDADG